MPLKTAFINVAIRLLLFIVAVLLFILAIFNFLKDKQDVKHYLLNRKINKTAF